MISIWVKKILFFIHGVETGNSIRTSTNEIEIWNILSDCRIIGIPK